MSRFIFITDLHLTTSAPVRTGDPLQDCLDKVCYVIEKANALDAQILIGGDIFDRPTIPYEAYTKVCKVFQKAKIVPIAVKGNHDQLFRSDDNDRKTTLNNAFSLGILQELNGTFMMEDQSCILTSDPKDLGHASPQILMYHGFLNTKDGKLTVYADDLSMATAPTLVLLGHDHVEYDPVQIGSCTVFRIGSLFRDQRVVTSNRTPKMLYIEVENGQFRTELLEVPARSVTDIFRETSGKVTTEVSSDYDTLISEFKNISEEDNDLMPLVSRVADGPVYQYIENLLNSHRINSVK